jgi:hypothetical protein
MLAAGGKDHQIWLWNIADPAHPVLYAAPAAAGDVYALAFIGENEIAVGSLDNNVTLIDTNADDALARICATAGDPVTPNEWSDFAPGVPYLDPCR